MKRKPCHLRGTGLGIGFVLYSPRDSGYLTDKIDETATFADNDIRSRNPHFTPEAIRANRVVVELFDRISGEKGGTPGQIALAWLLARRPWIVPIPGSRKLERLDENIDAVDVALTAEDLSDIQEAMAHITVVGDRYSGTQAQATCHTRTMFALSDRASLSL